MVDYVIISLVVLSLNFLAAVVYRENKSKPENRYFAFLSFWVSAWAICNFLEAEPFSHFVVTWLIRMDFASAALGAYFILLFCLYFPVPSFKNIPDKFLSIPTIIVFFASFTPWVVNSAILIEGRQPGFKIGPLFWLYAPVIGGSILGGVVVMARKWLRLTGLPKAQTSFVLLGATIFAIFAVIINLVIGYLFPMSVTFSRIGIYSVLPLAGFPAYAMVRYRLMDTRVFLRETTRYLFISGLLALIFGLVIEGLTRDKEIGGLVFIGALITPYIYGKLNEWMSRIRARSGLVDDKTSKAIHTIADRIKDAGYKISDLAETVVQMMLDQVPSDRCLMYVMNYDTRNFNLEAQLGFRDAIQESISMEDPLIKYLQEKPEILIKSEASRFLPTNKFNELEPSFKILNAELCAPLMVLDQIAGFIVLSPKRDNKPYFSNEVGLLKPIIDEASTALRYVLAVSIRAKETIKWAHSLHQSLKPLTVGFEFLSRRATANGTDKSLESVIPRLQGSIKRLGEFLRFLLQDSRLSEEALRNKYTLLPLNIAEVIDTGLSMHRITLESKKIKLDQKINSPESQLKGHSRDLASVFETLTSNALRYIPDEGIIKVRGLNQPNYYRVEFSNNGPQIPEANLKAIFTDRFQIKDGNQGMEGFGLANAFRILEMHKGKIWAENEKNPEGVKFILELPLIQD